MTLLSVIITQLVVHFNIINVFHLKTFTFLKILNGLLKRYQYIITISLTWLLESNGWWISRCMCHGTLESLSLIPVLFLHLDLTDSRIEVAFLYRRVLNGVCHGSPICGPCIGQ